MGPELTLCTLDPGIASVTDGTGAGGAVGPGLADCVRTAGVYNVGDNHVNIKIVHKTALILLNSEIDMELKFND